VSFLFITHDMAVAKVVARRIAVDVPREDSRARARRGPPLRPSPPLHKAMLQASPTIDPSMRDQIKKISIIGELAQSTAHPSGCKFNPRCPFAMDVCREKEPPLERSEARHRSPAGSTRPAR